MRRNQPEAAFQIQVAGFLSVALMPGSFFFHVPNGGRRSFTEGARFKAMGVKAGVPDLEIIHQGRAYWIELKREKGGRTSDAQVAIHAELVAAGCEAPAICKTLEEVKITLEIWKIPLRRVSLQTGRIIPSLRAALNDPHAFDVVTK